MVLYHTVNRFQEKVYSSPNQPHLSIHIYSSVCTWVGKIFGKQDCNTAGVGGGMTHWL